MAVEPVDPSLLAETPFFQLLDDNERAALAALLQKHALNKGEQLFRFGDPGDRAYLVYSGAVEIFGIDATGEKIHYTRAEPGDFFGEISLLDSGPRTASAQAEEDSVLLVLDHATLLRFIRMKPDAAMDLLAVLGTRIRQADAIARGRLARNPNVELEQKLSPIQRVATKIADFSGSMLFLALNVLLFGIWILCNVGVLPQIEAFDPYPFGFLTMAVSLEAIVLSILVLLAQNLQTERHRIRGNIEYDVNLKAEAEVAALHDKVDDLREDVLKRLERIEQRVK